MLAFNCCCVTPVCKSKQVLELVKINLMLKLLKLFAGRTEPVEKRGLKKSIISLSDLFIRLKAATFVFLRAWVFGTTNKCYGLTHFPSHTDLNKFIYFALISYKNDATFYFLISTKITKWRMKLLNLSSAVNKLYLYS